MNALRYREFGGPEKLKLEMVGVPKPGPGEVLVRVKCGGLNFADVLRLAGTYPGSPKPPTVLGFEAAGEVEAAGPDVDRFNKGDRVAFVHPGAFAELVVVPKEKVIRIPEALPFESAVALPVQGLTAWGLLNVSHRLKSGDRVLIHSAAGGVGGLAVQLAKAGGAQVFGTVSSEAKAKAAKDLGCEAVFDRSKGDFAQAVLAATGGKGVDLVLDAVGKDTLAKDFEATCPFGHVVVYGQSSGAPEPVSIDSLWKGSKKLSAFYLQDLMNSKAGPVGFQALTDSVLEGKLKVVIGAKYKLADGATAVKLLKEGKSVGKLVLQV